jgi:glutathione synthase/RimK-type ligase-like ATP-grasp enzyme
MLLVVTNSRDSTANYLCDKLSRLDFDFTRIDSDLACDRLTISFREFRPTLSDGARILRPEDITNVWLRRPKPLVHHVVSDDAEYLHIRDEWSEAIEGFFAHIPISRWINHPTANVLASHKIEQLSRASEYGLEVPRTLVTTDVELLRQFWKSCDGQVILKPLASGYIGRSPLGEDSLIYTNYLSESSIDDRILSACPTLFQEAIHKVSDVRVTVIDSHVHAVSLLSSETGPNSLDIRRNNMEGVRYTSAQVPEAIRDRLLRYLRSYHLRFAAVDFVVDSVGRWIFLEINPNGQWAWLDLVGCSDIARSFVEVFSSEIMV